MKTYLFNVCQVLSSKFQQVELLSFSCGSKPKHFAGSVFVLVVLPLDVLDSRSIHMPSFFFPRFPLYRNVRIFVIGQITFSRLGHDFSKSHKDARNISHVKAQTGTTAILQCNIDVAPDVPVSRNLHRCDNVHFSALLSDLLGEAGT